MMARGREHKEGSPWMELAGERLGDRGAPTAFLLAAAGAAAAGAADETIDDRQERERAVGSEMSAGH